MSAKVATSLGLGFIVGYMSRPYLDAEFRNRHGRLRVKAPSTQEITERIPKAITAAAKEIVEEDTRPEPTHTRPSSAE